MSGADTDKIMALADELALAVWQHETDNTLVSVNVKNARAALLAAAEQLEAERDLYREGCEQRHNILTARIADLEKLLRAAGDYLEDCGNMASEPLAAAIDAALGDKHE